MATLSSRKIPTSLSLPLLAFRTPKFLTEGNEFVVSAWDIIAGDVKPGPMFSSTMDAGDHAHFKPPRSSRRQVPKSRS